MNEKKEILMNNKKNKEEVQTNESEVIDKDLIKKIFLTDFSTIQSEIGRYDSHSLIIKGWAITLWSGLMYFIIKESIHELFIIQIILLLVFWSFDALYKFFQRRLALRYNELQKYFEGYNLNIGKKGELKIKYNENTRSGLKIINPREDFLDEKSEERKSLNRCILLRAVSVVYFYLISASFLISIFIIEFFLPILLLSIVILCFGIYTFFWGIDEVIEEYKKSYFLFFYSAIISIIANLILLGIYFIKIG